MDLFTCAWSGLQRKQLSTCGIPPQNCLPASFHHGRDCFTRRASGNPPIGSAINTIPLPNQPLLKILPSKSIKLPRLAPHETQANSQRTGQTDERE